MQQCAGSRPPGLAMRGLARGFSLSGDILLEFIVEDGSSFEVRSSNPSAACALLLNACANALTASLCELTWRDFFSRPQELQGRLTKAIFECVLLAGSSFSRLWRASAHVDFARA